MLLLHNWSLQLNVKSFCGGGWSSGLLSIYCSFITLFLIEHSLHFPNNNLISEGAGAQAALWHRAVIVPHGESTREAIHGGQTVNHCSHTPAHWESGPGRCSWLFPVDSNCTFISFHWPFGVILYSYCSFFSSILFCNCGIYSSLASINPHFLIQ